MSTPSPVFYFLLCFGIVTPCVFLACGRAVKSTSARFETQLSLTDAVRQLSILCASYNSTTLALRWVAGSVSKSNVSLECRTRGMKKPLMEFSGWFHEERKQVVLEGVFHMPFSVKCQLSLWLALLTFLVVLFCREVFINHNQEAATGIFIALGMAAFSIFVVKAKTEDSPSDMKWLASSIKNALQV